MRQSLLVGIAESGITHDMRAPPDLETKFHMVKDSGVYDCLDKTPSRADLALYRRLSERFDVPILAGGWYYPLGRDKGLLGDNLRIGADLGSRAHNTQIMMDHAEGRLVTDQEVADVYTSAYEVGARIGCLPMFEVHINMWPEDFH